MTPSRDFAAVNLARAQQRFRAARLGLLLMVAVFLATILGLLSLAASALAADCAPGCSQPFGAADLAVSLLALLGVWGLIDKGAAWLARRK